MAHSGVNGFGTSVRPPAHEITQVKVRKPTVRDLKALEPMKGAAARTAKMIELLTGLSAQEVAAIHAEDMKGLGEITALLFRGLEEVRSVLGMLMNRYRWSLTEVERLTADDIFVYQEKRREAEAALAAFSVPGGQPVDPAQFPLLAAEIGITAVDLQGVAQAVTSTALAWTQVAAVIETARLKAKRDIAEANTTAEINAILSAIAWGA
jgi:tail assembly chaperone E/41/14-like protein